MRFTIIIPVYNVKNHLKECLDSIIGQTFGDFEVIIVDDGSTDGSENICDLYQENHPHKIKVFHNANGGVLSARVFGVKQATGEIILFVDSDDCLRKDTLEILDGTIKKECCDMIIFNWSEDKLFTKGKRGFESDCFKIFEGNKKELYKKIIRNSSLNSICLKATKREIFDTEKDYSDFFHVRHGEDLLQSLQIITDAKKIVCIDEPLYYYRQRENSAVHTFDKNRHESIKAVHRELEKYIDLWGAPELHPLHYAREVRGWVETVFQFLENGTNGRTVISDMATDSYFRNAYENMDVSFLSKKDRIAAGLLYKRKYKLLLNYKSIIDFIKKLRKKNGNN